MQDPHRPASSGSIEFEPLTREDLPLLGRWLAAPHVRAWWRDDAISPADLEREYGPVVDATDPTRAFVIRLDGTPVGMIQCYRHADHPEWDRAVGIPAAAGIDYLIGDPGRCGRGVGSAAIAGFTSVVFDLYPDAVTVVAVPQADNRASRRALEKAGFRLLGERDLDSADPSDDGVSAVYALRRRR